MKNNKKMQKENLKKFLLVSNKYKSEENLKKIDKIKAIIDELEHSLGKEALHKIMATHKGCVYGKKYLKFLNLHRKINPKLIANKLEVKLHLICSWYRSYPPRPIKTLLNIYFNDYHKISKKGLSNLFGWGFGDGGLISALSYYFVCGKKEDLIRIKEYLNKEVPRLPIVLDKNFGNSVVKLVNGKTKNISSDNSWILYMRDSSFCKLLYALGLPKGEKVLQETQIPLWIKECGKDIKKAFLNSLLEGELQTHKVINNFKKNKIEIIPTTFGLSKIKEYKENLVEFLNELRVLLEEFNIKSTKVQKPIPSNIRKDGYITYSSRFYISTSALNIVNISKIIDFPFNRQKRDGLKVAINEAKVKIQKMENQVAKYKKALELSKKRLSIYKIAKILNIQWHTANNWVNTKKHLPTLLNAKLGETSNDCEIK